MYRFLIIPFVILFLLAAEGSAQVIDLDDEQELVAPDKFEKSTMYYISPGDFGYQMGFGNMHELMVNSLDIDPNKFIRFVGFGLGWKRKAMYYNFYAAFQPFTRPLVKTSGNLRTVADFSTVFAEITVGRAIVTTDRHNIILKGGLGLFGNELQLRRYNTDSFDLNNFGIGQGTAWPLLEHYSGTYDVAVELIPHPIRTLAVLASFQLGYKGSIGSPNWMSPDAFLSNSITDRVSMVYLRLSLVISRQY